MNEQLKPALKQEDTILFIGSGISCWAGLPSWMDSSIGSPTTSKPGRRRRNVEES